MKRIILVTLVGGLLGACANADVLTSSERHISLVHGSGKGSVTKAFQLADKHCRQYNKTAVQTVSGNSEGPSTSTFECR